MFGTRSFHAVFNASRIAATVAGLGAALWLAAFAGPAAAAEKSANLDKYCKARYGHDYVTNIDRRSDGFLCTKRTSGGLGLLHLKVFATDICRRSLPLLEPDGNGRLTACHRRDEISLAGIRANV